MNRKFKFLHVLPIRRAANGWVFGVFKGLAEHTGFPCVWTRVLGVLVLLGMGGSLNKGDTAVPIGAIVLYIVLALIMQPPQGVAEGIGSLASGHNGASSRLQPVFPVGGSSGGNAPRPLDLAALEQRLESLGRRVAKMENVVVTRERDWDRRLGA